MGKIEQMIKFCDKEDIYWYNDFVYYCSEHHKDWLATLMSEKTSRMIWLYLISKAYKAGFINDKDYEECAEI